MRSGGGALRKERLSRAQQYSVCTWKLPLRDSGRRGHFLDETEENARRRMTQSPRETAVQRMLRY